ncbi:MAG: Crp/Fnr family transcriptional regulator [Bacteroidetes bacterium]|nr:Crp/Fnr family transcriptional regulator [Bacteroidota bacterium]
MATYLKTSNCVGCQRKFNIFRSLSDEELTIINEYRNEVIFNTGEIMFKQGSPLTHIACLTSGMAKIYIEGFNKKNLILKILLPGEIVGGPGLFVDYVHHFTVATLQDSTACFIHVDAIKEVVSRNSGFAFELLRHVNERDIKNFDKILNLTQKQMPGRMADTLLYLAKAIHKANKFESRLSRQDIADLSAMTKESAIRILKEFKDEGIISVDGDRFEILNENALLNISRKG